MVDGPGQRRAPFAAVTAALVLALLALGTLPSPTRVERVAPDGPERAGAPPRPATTTTTAAPATVVAGRHEVGAGGVRPGRYVTTGDLCTWERLGPGGQVLITDTGTGQVLVDVRATDAGFSSSPGCGTWRTFTPGPPLCDWERLSGLGGGLDELLASAGVPGPAEVVVAPTDAAFRSFGCGTWHPLP